MSRDLTCNETMPALDEGDSLADVRRMIPSRIINQQQFTTSLNLMANNRVTSSANSANMTVRDVVSNRIRNRGNNESVFTGLSANQTPVSASTPTYMIKTTGIGISGTANNNLMQSFIDETSRNNQSTTKYVTAPLHNNHNILSSNQFVQQSHQTQSQQLFQQPQHYTVSTAIPLQRLPSSSAPSLYRQQNNTISSDILPASQKIGISVAYSSNAYESTNINNIVPTQTIVVSNNPAHASNNGTLTTVLPASSVSIKAAGNPSITTISQNNFTNYVLPTAYVESGTVVGVNGTDSSGVVYTNVLQRATDSPGKLVYFSRQASSSTSPSSMVFMSGGGSNATSHFVQQTHSSNQLAATYSSDVAVGSIVRSTCNNNSFIGTPTKQITSTVSSGNNGCLQSVGRGASPYAVIMPRSDSVLQGSISRESPNNLSNHGCTTPTNSQVPPNSHSSPRPSILRGNNAARRFMERDATPISSATNFTTLNFSNVENNPTGVSALNFYGSNATSSSTSNDGMGGDLKGFDCISNSQDDSPRKRQRKQQFDNSQLQDKLMMEVHADPRLEQIATENSALWKLSSGSSIPFTMVKNNYNVGGGDFSGNLSALAAREPRRRGRPRSVNRPAELLQRTGSSQSPHSRAVSKGASHSTTNSAATISQNFLAATSSTGGAASIALVAGTKQATYAMPLATSNGGSNSTVVAYGTAPPPAGAFILPGGGEGVLNNTSAPRSFMVDVDDRMLEVPPATKRPRKYKKRTPELDPETGAPVKKPRKKGSGRKSKKDLLFLEATKREIDVFGVDANHTATIGELLAKSSSISGASNHRNVADLQQHIQQQQPFMLSQKFSLQQHAQPVSTTVANTPRLANAVTNLEQQNMIASFHQKQQHFAKCDQSSNMVSATTTASTSFSSRSLMFAQLAVEEQSGISTLCKLKLKSKDAVVKNGAINLDTKVNRAEKPEVKTEEHTDKQINRLNNFAKDLLDASKYCDVNGLWKAADRNLALSLSEEYDEILTFLSNVRLTNKVSGDKRRHMQFSKFDKCEVFCPMFDSFEEFKDSLHLLKLMPTTCKYFKSSKTLLDSLRNNLYGFSAYHLAKNLIEDTSPDEKITHSMLKVDAKRAKTIASLRSTERRLQGKCEDLFEFLYRELKQRMESPIARRDGAVNLAKSLLIDMTVVELLDKLTDTVDRQSDDKLTNDVDEQPSISCQSQHLSNFSPSEVDDVRLSNCILPTNMAVFIPKIPKQYHQILFTSNSALTRRRKAHRRSRKYCESSSESENQLTDYGMDGETEIPEDQKAKYAFQKLHEFNDRCQKVYRAARRQSSRLLEKLEPDRYREFVSGLVGIGCDLDGISKAASNDEATERIREDVETAFLLEVPKYPSSFKPLSIYNSTKSITMKPSKELVNLIFKGTNIPYYAPGIERNVGKRLKLPAVERLREVEKNFLVLEEIKQMERNSAHIVAISAERLLEKYNEKRQFSYGNKNHFNGTDNKMSSSSDEGNAFNFDDFDRSLKRQFPRGDSKNAQIQYFNDRCKELHEIAAVVVGLSHSRSNVLRQCYESLVDVIKTKSSMMDSFKTNPSAIGTDSEMEQESIAPKSFNEYEFEVDSPAGSHLSDNESENLSEDDEDNLVNVKKKFNHPTRKNRLFL